MKTPQKVCRRCYGHAVSLDDVTAPTRAIRPFVVSPKGYVHKPQPQSFGLPKTECGWDFTAWLDA